MRCGARDVSDSVVGGVGRYWKTGGAAWRAFHRERGGTELTVGRGPPYAARIAWSGTALLAGSQVLWAIRAMTSKCGGRRSRVTVLAVCTERPAFSAKRFSSFSLKPRLTCP